MITAATTILVALSVWILIEAALHALVSKLRPSFQWLIGPKDVAPEIGTEIVRQYMERSFDSELGWLRKPGSTGTDQGDCGTIHFRIDDAGCRANPNFERGPSDVAVFGDSYAFCRLVRDDETWPHFLSVGLKTNVRNFGVGNYGIDQALLRLERELPRLDSKVIVMGIVHETIARAHSYWKHYFEYGNVLAFKPRFALSEGKLIHHRPAMQTPADFASYRQKLDRIQALDRFYLDKFRRDLLKFPYLPRLIARWRRHAPILWHLACGRLSNRHENGRRKALEVVARENGRVTAALFSDPGAKALLTEVLRRFADSCMKWDRLPLLIVLPQPVDVEWRSTGRDDSRSYFAELEGILPVIDFTDRIMNWPNWRSLYVGGPQGLGPHFNATGNQLIATVVAEHIERLKSFGTTALDRGYRDGVEAKSPRVCA